MINYFKIRKILAKDTLPIRQLVLRDGKIPIKHCEFEDDNNPFSFHLGAIKENKMFININNKDWKYEDVTRHPWYSKIMVLWKDYIEEYIPYENLINKNFVKDHKSCAQFYVNKSRILRYPKIFYENLYNWLLTTKISSYESSRYMEKLWHVFWEDKDKILN